MIIFSKNNITYCFIHIPKASGTYVRDTLEKFSKREKNMMIIKRKYNINIIKKFWGVDNKFDLAHIPYSLSPKYFQNISNQDENINYFSFVRNPYDRMISAFNWKHVDKKPIADKIKQENFRKFVKNELLKYDLNTFKDDNVHYIPQYKFLITNEDDSEITNNVKFYRLEDFLKKSEKIDENLLFLLEKFRLKSYNYKEYYDEETISIVNSVYEKDFTLLGYKIMNPEDFKYYIPITDQKGIIQSIVNKKKNLEFEAKLRGKDIINTTKKELVIEENKPKPIIHPPPIKPDELYNPAPKITPINKVTTHEADVPFPPNINISNDKVSNIILNRPHVQNKKKIGMSYTNYKI